MTVEEKAGQLNQAAGIRLPGVSEAGPHDAIRKGQAGSVLWLTGAEEINRLQRIAMEESRLRIPLLVGFDVVHGYRTTFPVPLAMAASWDPSVHEQAQRVAAEDARAAGVNWTFAPMVDISRDARWGRIVEGAGEDPHLGSAMAQAQIRGFHGPALGPASLLACVKHFAGYGAAEGGRDYDSVYTERLMKLPKNNPDGYRRTAPRLAADKLQAKMLLVHGTMDDNVHMQNSVQFAYELQRLGKPFEMMVYAKQRHGFSDPLLIKHVHQLEFDFVMRAVGTPPAPSTK